MGHRFKIEYLPSFFKQMQFIEKKYWKVIRANLEEQLMHEPMIETRNRKPLDPAEEYGSWELRFGPANKFRVFYDILPDSFTVHVNAIGVKVKEKLFIGGEEIL